VSDIGLPNMTTAVPKKKFATALHISAFDDKAHALDTVFADIATQFNMFIRCQFRFRYH